MKKEFIPYEQALALKELGFNQPCIAHYTSHGYYDSVKKLKWKRPIFSLCGGVTITNDSLTWQEDPNVILKQVIAPTFSQAFRWFREKYGLITCNDYGNNEYFYWIISKDEKMFFNNEDEEGNVTTYKTYEEAELECLKKLIEIVKNKYENS